ncbi:conserved Plasmodium protein, unknown function [Plasmodium knowlesi strain H]|uniref:Dynein attachment factor N-terminal domain-containing protein n=3 Tax=Plasmodium knowlesi TaxID=5850 RepID=A0A5K1V7Y7_PLAKH|nr:conserved Plasmodium protein, unknown function [Plasmodium knowlesi strain H]OTN65980.1 Uncharacterized protein PKNOH_S100030500 [Plasmodium knowlesi]CAA9987670.1 conserved Plasmodium protein, unknown function [Plasmodium knowlesi strain H]SBO29652.1 conserved Plasmodium protein, unknown function [Plasmodium knowlesi strain H]VVS77144.1 conserved Plasmodium protein, unknown function [Plasmodium knowlesi strain H]|eukprot:XP_002258668.1 hypothetical protein, conserved in Plasmodium species [Plasmodium knowlesi strain H]
MDPADGIAPIQIRKMRNDFVRCIIKDEEFKKKDEKKKEIVKYCKSYKDFCNIVSSVNMKPVRTYEQKVSYEDYINLNLSSSKSQMESTKRRNRRSQNYELMNFFHINSPLQVPSPEEIEQRKSAQEIRQLLTMLRDKQKDYVNFVKRNYTSDELTDVLDLIRRKWDDIFQPNPADDPKMEKTPPKFLNLASFLIHLVDHWKKHNLSAYFTQDELNNINLNLQDIIGKMEKTASTYYGDDIGEASIMINQLKMIHL